MMEAEEPPPPISTVGKNNNCHQNRICTALAKSNSFLIGLLFQVTSLLQYAILIFDYLILI